MIIQITLDEEDFRRLVAGPVVEKSCLSRVDGHPPHINTLEMHITLSDIGWGRIGQAVVDAMGKAARAFLPRL